MVKDKNYYAKIESELHLAGYEKPGSSEDPRYRLIWEYVIEHQISARVVEDFDYKTGLHPRTHRYYPVAQLRTTDTSGDETKSSTKVKGFLEKFYEGADDYLEPQYRVSIGWPFESAHLFSVGNTRVRSHEAAAKKEYSTAAFPPLILGEELEEDEILDHIFNISELSNRDTGEEPQLETMDDIVNQLNVWRTLRIKGGDIDATTPKSDLKDFAEKFINERKTAYRGDHMKGIRTKIINAWVGGEERPGAIAPPDTDTIAEQWSNHYGENYKWDPDNDKSEIWQPELTNAETQPLEGMMWRRFRHGEGVSDFREEVHLTLTVGGRKGPTVYTADTVVKGRTHCLEVMVAWNTNERLIKAGFAKVMRIMFVKQLNSCADDYEVWEWATDGSEQFFKVERR